MHRVRRNEATSFTNETGKLYAKNFEDHKKDHYLEDYLNNGIASYCGVQDSTVTFLYNTIAFEEETSDLGKHHEALITQAKGVIIDLATEIQKEIAV
jgi:hypothetical protein